MNLEILRESYLGKLISYQWDGQVNVITGLRRSGKSYLLRKLYKDYLNANGVADSQIISIDLEKIINIRYRNPLEMASYIRSAVEGKSEKFYLFVDEIQLSDMVPNPYNPSGKKITFCDALNDLRGLPNLDVYVTAAIQTCPSCCDELGGYLSISGDMDVLGFCKDRGTFRGLD